MKWRNTMLKAETIYKTMQSQNKKKLGQKQTKNTLTIRCGNWKRKNYQKAVIFPRTVVLNRTQLFILLNVFHSFDNYSSTGKLILTRFVRFLSFCPTFSICCQFFCKIKLQLLKKFVVFYCANGYFNHQQ